MKNITKNVYWERNSRTERNANIKNQIISKTTTGNFPHGAATVRCERTTSKFPSVGVYFYGKPFSNNPDYISNKLLVWMTPDSKHGGYYYKYKGNTKISMREIADYCEYIESEMENM